MISHRSGLVFVFLATLCTIAAIAVRNPSLSGRAQVRQQTSTSIPKVFSNKYGIEFVQIPAGHFMMGANGGSSEKPIHEVRISRPFYMGKYEVTQAQWKKVMGNNPSRFKQCGDNCPVDRVTWNEALRFINRLNKMNDGYKYRLPSEAEWEYACRAGSTGEYYGNLDEIAWYEHTSGNKPHPVGKKQPNSFGLYDMSGNVWELVQDQHHDSYDGAPADGSPWITGGEDRVSRGGSWLNHRSMARSATRAYGAPDRRGFNFGFRVVAVLRSQ